MVAAWPKGRGVRSEDPPRAGPGPITPGELFSRSSAEFIAISGLDWAQHRLLTRIYHLGPATSGLGRSSGTTDSKKRGFPPIFGASGASNGFVRHGNIFFGEQPRRLAQLPQLDVVMPWNPGWIHTFPGRAAVGASARRWSGLRRVGFVVQVCEQRRQVLAGVQHPRRGWWSDYTRAGASSAGSTSSETAPAADLGGAGRARDARRYARRRPGLRLGRALLLPPQCRGRAASRPHYPDPHSPGAKNSGID